MKAIVIACGIFVTSLSGCFRSPDSSYFQLSASDMASAPSAYDPNGPSVAMVGLNMPKALIDPRITVLLGSNEVSRDEFERWAEDIDSNFKRVLLENLTSELRSSNVFNAELYPERQASVYLRVEVLWFESRESGSSTLRTRWLISDRLETLASSKMIISEYFSESSETGTHARVATLSSLVARLAQDVAQAITAQSRDKA